MKQIIKVVVDPAYPLNGFTQGTEYLCLEFDTQRDKLVVVNDNKKITIHELHKFNFAGVYNGGNENNNAVSDGSPTISEPDNTKSKGRPKTNDK